MNYTIDYTLSALDSAVLDQLGIEYTESASGLILAEEDYSRLQDISRYGINGGFTGFIYYSDTVKFAEDNFKLIKESLEELYGSMGEDVIEGLKSWGCLRDYDLSSWEVAEALYNPESEWRTQVFNALAWYAAEETAHAIADADAEEEEKEAEEA